MRTGPLQRVLVRPPKPDDVPSWRELGWRAEPDPAGLVAEHEALCTLLEDGGAEVVRAGGQPRSLDAIYTFDPLLMTDSGALLLRPGKPQRRDEPEALLGDLVRAGIPVVGGLEEPALAEGGDTLWLDERTLVVGRSYRTNGAGVAALQAALPDVEVVSVDLPHLHGRGEVLHLLSLISPLDDDLAVVYLPLLPVRLVELLQERGVELVEVPDAEFETMGPNVLALGPRVGLAIEGNETTRRRLERAGVEVLVYRGERDLAQGRRRPDVPHAAAPARTCRFQRVPFVVTSTSTFKEEPQMKYMLLVYDVPAEWTNVTEDEMQGLYAEYAAVSNHPATLGGGQLQPVTTAKTVRINGGDTLATDGPFAETKEHLGGYYLVEADSIDDAVAIAAKVPSARMGGSVEVRPLVEM